jgi:hypothetical protein
MISSHAVHFEQQVLSSLSALSPNSQTRFLSFRLLATIVLKHTGTSRAAEVIQLALLKDLLTENGTPSFRTACIGIVKEVLNAKFENLQKVSFLFFSACTSAGTDDLAQSQDSNFKSILLTSEFLDELGSTLLRFDPPTLFDDGEISPEQFVEEHQRDVSQKLNFYFFLVTKDQSNEVRRFHAFLVVRSRAHFLFP